jgi:hypothetical protein
MYSSVPAVALLGLRRVWAMVLPEPALPPLMLPLIVPTVHVKVLGVLAVSAIFVAELLQIVAVLDVVTTGVG